MRFPALLRAMAVLPIAVLLFATSFVLQPSAVAAQDLSLSSRSPHTVVRDRLVVSASRVERERDAVGSSVTVIDREEIERRHAITVFDLLRTVPGLEVTQSGGPGKATSVFIRGGNSAHTLVLLDGIRLNDNTTGAFDLSDLTTANVERIEVVRGPQGTLYGSEAVAGVINIVTRRGGGPATPWGTVEGGSNDHRRLRLGVDGGTSRFDYSLSLSDVETDGVSAASEDAGNTEDDPWENTTFSGRLGGAFFGDGRIDLTLRHIEGDTAIDGFTFGVGPTDDLNNVQSRETTSAALRVVKPLSSIWTQTFLVGTTENTLEGSDPDPADIFNNFRIDGETIEFLTQADVTVAKGQVLSFGVRQEERDAESVGSFDESVDLTSVFVEHSFSVRDRHHFTVSLRNDDHSRSGNETTYRVTASVRAGERVRLHGSFGTGFKAPTFNDLYFPGFGNLNLDPETSEGFDLGVETTWLGGELVFDVTAFSNSFDDLILFTFPAGFVNVAKAESDGVELELAWEPSSRVQLRLGHTFNDTEDLSTGLQLARRPENRTTFFVGFQATPKLGGTVAAVAVSDRLEFDGTAMDDYERVDLTLDYEIRKGIRPYLRVENLFDADYVEVPGFTTPGAVAILGVDLRLAR